MSTDHDLSAKPPLRVQHGLHSRRTSTDSQKSKSVSNDKLSNASATSLPSYTEGNPSIGSAAESKALELERLLNYGQSLTNNPDEAREWISKLGMLREGTNVLTHQAEVVHKEEHVVPTRNFLSILVEWTTVWFNKVERARREHKSTRGSSIKEQSDLDWLFRYIQDYLQLKHVTFQSEELVALIDGITNICLRTNKQSDINNALEILHIILRHYEFPKQSLEPTLIVLSASLANLPETPRSLQMCFVLLATGKWGSDVVDILCNFVRTPTLQNNTKNLSHARGATRLLRSVVDMHNNSGEFVFQLSALASTMYDASEQRIFRFCTDILQCWHAILSAEYRIAEVLSLDFSKIIKSLESCMNTKPPDSHDSTGTATTSSNTSLPDDEIERPYERHLRDREVSIKSIEIDLENLWPTVSDERQNCITEHVLSFPRFATSTQLLRSIDQITSNGSILPPAPMWEAQLDRVLSAVVCDSRVDPQCRIEVLRVLDGTAGEQSVHFDSRTDVTSEQLAPFLSKLATAYLEQSGFEIDRTVLEALLVSLQRLAVNETIHATSISQPATIVQKLQMFAMSTEDTTDLHDFRATSAAKSLASIFVESLQVDPRLTLLTYDALVDAASLQCKSRRARIEAMRVLFRIRVDSHGLVFFQTFADSDYIATALCRTRASAEAFNPDQPSTQRQSASSSSVSSKSTNHDPLWMYEDSMQPHASYITSRKQISVDSTYQKQSDAVLSLDITAWLLHVIRGIQSDTDWETYSFMLIHLGSQLSNVRLFNKSLYTIVKLRQILCEQIVNSSFKEPPAPTGLKKSDIALCLYNLLTQLVPYASIRREPIQKGFGDDLVRAFLTGIGGVYEGTSRGCIHALSICSFEIPSSIATLYPSIVDKLSKNMTQTHLTMIILEFLSQLATLPAIHSRFNQDEITVIFGVCIQFLEKMRDQNQSASTSHPSRVNASARQSGVNLKRPPYRAEMLKDIPLSQYAAALAYHTMIFWFLSLRLDVRSKLVSWIVPRLVWKNSRGEETIDEQSQVFIDMMQRTAFSDLGETLPNPSFAEPQDGPVTSASWIVGLSFVTVETAGRSGLTQITKRQASGTTHATYQQLTTELPSHHIPNRGEMIEKEADNDAPVEMLPPHILLQMVSTAAPTSVADQPTFLPKEDHVTRAFDAFDRIPTVDSHKIGVLFIGSGQTAEMDFLLNEVGTHDYDHFLEGLGYTVSLKPPLRFNPQGLQYPRDGNETIAWRDKTFEIVFLVPTMMPNDPDEDPDGVNKKAHVGNCHVNIIFNRSGKLWKFENFKSQLNYVNIVISPASRCHVSRTRMAEPANIQRQREEDKEMPEFYKVHCITRDDLPNISPAADPKIISAEQLPGFVRVIAMNANIFSQAWNSKAYDKEFPSTWRARLQHIKMLKERIGARNAKQDPGSSPAHAISPGAASPSPTPGRRTPVPRDDVSGARKDGALATQLDFSKWTLKGS